MHAQVPGQLYDAGLGRRISHLGCGRPDISQEGGGVDHRAAGRVGVPQVRNAVLAGQEDAGQVRVLDPAPGLQAGVQRRTVAGIHQPHVVVDDVEPAVLPHDLLIHRLDLRLVGQIGLHREPADRMLDLVDANHHATLAREPPGDRPADHAPGPVDHADPARKPVH